MSHLPGKFVWFEHLSSDVSAAIWFYEALFGWKVTPTPVGGTDYDLILLRGGEVIGGFRPAPEGVPTQWTSYLSVADVDADFVAAVEAGARGLMPPTEFGPMGRGAALADPTGAAFWLWKGALGDRADRESVAMGDWYWNELCTPDPQTAKAFYERVFGFTTQLMPNNPAGDYLVLSKHGTARGGIVRPPGGAAKPMWLPYVHVDDCDAASSRAQRLGARNLVAPTDIPEIGRFAAFLDPLGAPFAVIRSHGVRLSDEELASDADPGPAL